MMSFACGFTVLFVVALLNVVLALVPHNSGVFSPGTSSTRLKQNTRQRIIQQAISKSARQNIIQVRANQPDVFARTVPDSQTSSKPYPTCPGSKGLGYAHYPSWDYYSNDIPGNPRYASPNTEGNCIALCNAHQLQPRKRTDTPDTSCIGAVYIQSGPCYLKGELYQYGRFQKSDNAQLSTDLVGSCAAWKGVVPSDMDAACCNM